MTQWKDKAARTGGRTVALFDYPVQAADVPGLTATHVPGRRDQKQHITGARYCAKVQ
jgi:tryptophanyl-tRNA synthetase